MNKLRLIQCGVGGFGAEWLKRHTTASPDFELAALVDISSTALEQASAASGISSSLCFSSLEAALKAVEADAVLSVTPPAVHCEHARLAFGNGLHLITEKPLADTIENAREMIRLAKAAGRQLVVSQQYRFGAPVQKLKELVDSEVVGKFGHGHIDFYIPGDFTGTFRETMEFPLLLDMAIHHVDLIRCITGRDVLRVTAHSFRPDWSWYKHDSGLRLLLELEGNLPFSYAGDWSALGRTTSWNGSWRLQCAEGSLHLENDAVLIGRCQRWGRELSVEEVPPTPLARAGQAQSLHLFAEAIRSGIPAEISGANNLGSFATVVAAIQSAREHRTVSLAEIVEKT